MTDFERQQIFATGMRQALADRHAQEREIFDREWRALDAVQPTSKQEAQKAA
jgi:hypothetical protein